MFEWDEAKRAWTRCERGLDFLAAIRVFDGRLVLNLPVNRRDEAPFLSVASIDGKFYAVVWTWRGENRRIISFRRARRAEETQYRAVYG
ncbi:MAG TPA: BrnT family toxin [Stellaceae bacterium]